MAAVQHKQHHAVGTTVAGARHQYFVGQDRFLRRVTGRGVVSQDTEVSPEDVAEFEQFPASFRVVKSPQAAGTAAQPVPPADQRTPDPGEVAPQGGGEPPSPPVLPFGGLLAGSVHKIRGDLLTGRFDGHLDDLLALEIEGKNRTGVKTAIEEQKALIAGRAAEARKPDPEPAAPPAPPPVPEAPPAPPAKPPADTPPAPPAPPPGE